MFDIAPYAYCLDGIITEWQRPLIPGEPVGKIGRAQYNSVFTQVCLITQKRIVIKRVASEQFL